MEWKGFSSPEAANGHIQIFESLFPLGDGFSYSFLRTDARDGVILKIEIQKSRSVKLASDGTAYVRRGAQNIPYTTPEDLERLKRNKGLTSFETELISADPEILTIRQ
jgi:ATP-dependent DNA helicase RecG